MFVCTCTWACRNIYTWVHEYVEVTRLISVSSLTEQSTPNVLNGWPALSWDPAILLVLGLQLHPAFMWLLGTELMSSWWDKRSADWTVSPSHQLLLNWHNVKICREGKIYWKKKSTLYHIQTGMDKVAPAFVKNQNLPEGWVLMTTMGQCGTM